MQPQAVSSLSRPSGEGELAGERNTGFHTPVGKTLTSERNTIEACVHGTQTVSDGQALRIRLLEPMVVDDRFIPKGTVVTGGTRIRGERLDILVTSLEYKGTLLPVELEVYDSDGLQGIPVPNSMEYDAAREIAANMGGSMNSSINISTDAGAQIASDLGKGVIQGSVAVCHQEDAHRENHPEGRAPAAAPLTRTMKEKRLFTLNEKPV